MISFRDFRLYFLEFNIKFKDVVVAYKDNPVYGEDTASLAGFARAMGIPRRTAQNWFSGLREPPEYLLILICYTLCLDGCSVIPPPV